MKTNILLITLFCLGATSAMHAVAQDKFIVTDRTVTRSNGTVATITNSYSSQQGKVLEPITLYDIDGKPTTCEDNLKNLLKAWNKDNISNADEFKILSYKSLGAIQDTIQAKKYAKQMTKIDSPLLSPEVYSSSKQKKNTITIHLSSYKQGLQDTPREHKKEAKKNIENAINRTRTWLGTSIKQGFEAYSVLMDHKGQKLEFFVFCDPTTKQVAVDYVFKNIILGYNN